MSIIDWHSHILPKLDDGSKSLDMSTDILQESARQKVNIMIATPHFYGDHMTPELFFKRRQTAYNQVKEIASKHKINIGLGAEVAMFKGMDEWSGLERFAIQGTNLILIEMPFTPWTADDLETLENIRLRGLRPIIAHVERFRRIPMDKAIYNEIFDMGFIIQYNCEDLLSFFPKHRLFKLMNNTDNFILGSDCHNSDTRPQNMRMGRAVLKNKYGADILKKIDDYGMSLLVKSK